MSLATPGSQKNPFLLGDSPLSMGSRRLILGPASTSSATGSQNSNLAAVRERIIVLESVASMDSATVGAGSSSTRRPKKKSREARGLDMRELRFGPLPPPRLPRNPAPILGGLRIIRRPGPNSVAVVGWRMPREQALTHEDLWVDGVGPSDQLPLQEHHKCGICRFAKSHPVTILCGHSYCYVCIRLWLEHKWTCPECVTQMWMAPFRQFAEEASLRAAYPNWHDASKVLYKWDNLIFPRKPRVVYEQDSD
ncbi:hypothetical protein C8R43DRAFT_1137632 [Mycena crocata]|nr:hypothetical protein C8R43DRAFT_1137632 [Mycena crocata]